MKIFLTGVAAIAAMSVMMPVYAAVNFPGLETTAKTAGINRGVTDPTTATANLISQVLSYVGILFLILMIYGGFMWMTAAGNEERVKTALKVVASAVIGLIIVLSAYAITRFVGGQFTTF